MSGDFVVVRKQPTAENAETVVALINNEATITKKYYKRRRHIELRPAHEGMEPIVVSKGDLRIEGKVVGIIRYCNKKMQNI